MQNEEGQKVDLYIPRKWYVLFYDSECCGIHNIYFTVASLVDLIRDYFVFFFRSSYTNRLITAKDHSSVQINVGHVDQNGVYTGEFTPFALCGYIRKKAAGDEAMNQLLTKKGFIKNVI